MLHKDLVGNGPAIVSLPIEDMTCASCAWRVEAALRKIAGVASVAVNLATELTEVRTNGDGTVDCAALGQAIKAARYDVPAQTIELSMDGMACVSCVGPVERSLRAVLGVVQAAVNMATDPGATRGVAAADALVAAIDKAGCEGRIVEALALPGDDRRMKTGRKNEHW